MSGLQILLTEGTYNVPQIKVFSNFSVVIQHKPLMNNVNVFIH